MSQGITRIEPMEEGGKPFIQSYGDGGFRIGGRFHPGSVLVLPERVLPWAVDDPAAVDFDSLSTIVPDDGTKRILLVGCGSRFVRPPPGLAQSLRKLGLAFEWMDTGAACRTFNILLTEDRPAIAALIMQV